MRRPLLFTAAALTLLVVAVARTTSPIPANAPGRPDLTIGIGMDGSPLPSINRRSESSAGDATTVYWIVGVLAGLLLITALTLTIRAARQRKRTKRGHRHATASQAVPRTPVAHAVEQARELLARPGGNPSNAVIAAWLALEQATAGRKPHQTATEFASMLPAEQVDEQALTELRTLYQRARFSAEPVTEDDIANAQRALDRVLGALR